MDAEGLSRLFATPVAACVATPAMYDAPPLGGEAEIVAKAVDKRRREFAAGRACARAALAELGVAAQPILRDGDRAPVWPAGYVGSIAHCDSYCAVVAARSSAALGVGFDAEDAAPLEPGMARRICRADELERFTGRPDPAGSNWPKVAFSAKEAFYKCWHPLVGRFLEFGDVSVWFVAGDDPAGGAFRVVVETPDKSADGLERRMHGLWRIEDGRVYAGVTLPPV